MASKWRKAKLALGLNPCFYVPRTLEDSPPQGSERLSDAALLSSANWDSKPMTPTPSSNVLRLSKNGSKSSKVPNRQKLSTSGTKKVISIGQTPKGHLSYRTEPKKQTCPICLAKVKQGDGQAIFTAECSHSFHFHCIASNVKHGNQICPVCRAKWKEIPLQAPNLNPPLHNGPSMTVGPRRDSNRRPIALPSSEPNIFNDDESLDIQPMCTTTSPIDEKSHCSTTMEIQVYPEVSSVQFSTSLDNFTLLVHLKAASNLVAPRAPVDLVTVLDISGSMAGTKLALLKRAMGFVIQSLGSNDRLSVIAFSSTARRLFPLRRMSDSGRHLALQAVNSLVANGGTNIAHGLVKGFKVMEDRRDKNSVASIILLSDGQDTYTVNQPQPNYRLLLPLDIHVPVHTFGFGADHDASSMHSVSEISGGTFSFIETEGVIQDAFAQCIGGLLSVVIQELQVGLECLKPDIRLVSLKAGSYTSRVMDNSCRGFIEVGDLYADEERDFLVSVNVPEESSGNRTSLLKVRCFYKDPFTKQKVTLESEEITLQRPVMIREGEAQVSVEVDRQRNRLQAAGSMSQARSVAEQGDLGRAVAILEDCRRMLSETISAKSRDRLCVALDAELKEMQERMASRHVYEASGRAYVLSGLSSHSWQRATARGDSTDGSSLVQAYQTPSMTQMLTRSQAMLLGSPSGQRLIQPSLSFGSQPNPR